MTARTIAMKQGASTVGSGHRVMIKYIAVPAAPAQRPRCTRKIKSRRKVKIMRTKKQRMRKKKRYPAIARLPTELRRCDADRDLGVKRLSIVTRTRIAESLTEGERTKLRMR